MIKEEKKLQNPPKKKCFLFFLSLFFLFFLTLELALHPKDDLHCTMIPGQNGRVLICFHGSGDNYKIAKNLKNLGIVDSTLVSFNFPDHDLGKRSLAPSQLTFGTFKELCPAFLVMKEMILDQKMETVDLMGFSAGGGALVNLLAILNTHAYDVELLQMGIGALEKKRLLEVIQKGIVILDTPLKSIEEIIAVRGSSNELETLAQQYRKHHLRPIDNIKNLHGLSLNIILHFQEKDEILSNRDDPLFIKELQEANLLGKTFILITNDGGHLAPHVSLWHFYAQKIKEFFPKS